MNRKSNSHQFLYQNLISVTFPTRKCKILLNPAPAADIIKEYPALQLPSEVLKLLYVFYNE